MRNNRKGNLQSTEMFTNTLQHLLGTSVGMHTRASGFSVALTTHTWQILSGTFQVFFWVNPGSYSALFWILKPVIPAALQGFSCSCTQHFMIIKSV